ncbi:transcriptional regulator [Lysinibacillus phage vB_LfM_LysYB2]|nr:transcriptional regulator [Lysinibacillus phage vB_LfM_LysYB2]
MIQIQYMKPFHTRIKGNQLRLVFAYQYMTIMKEEETFFFVPIEGKEMVVDMEKEQIVNLNEVFVFQKGNRFIRLPLYQLMLVSNIDEHLEPILDAALPSGRQNKTSSEYPLYSIESKKLIETLERKNYDNLIDQALLDKDEAMFYELLRRKEGAV